MMRSSLLFALAIGCGGNTPSIPDAPTDGFDRSAMLAHLGQNVLLPVPGDVAAKTSALTTAVGAYCAELDAGSATPDAVRDAWRTAMDATNRLDAVVIGPAAMDGKALQSRIYAWPLLSTCDVDRDTASRFANPGSYDVSAKLDRARSLAAVEFLLFTTNTNHTCVVEPTGWAALGTDLPRARCRLAEVIAADVAATATQLDTAWRVDGGNFVTDLATAGSGSSDIPSAQEGVNRVSDGMFFVDRIVKDMKLAEPAGIAINACGTVGEPCLSEVEHPFADYTSQSVRTNLRMLREVFTGTSATADGPAFDDFLIGVGHDDVAARMTQNLDAAIAAADALPDSFLGALANNLPAIEVAHTAIKTFTDDLKSQFLTLLSLEIPDDVATDND
ncbi:MAG: imelysin family protein [Deltaproteobacteria bacterium]|nr:imelysin family protein [Deltaproteobacteria bacterium]